MKFKRNNFLGIITGFFIILLMLAVPKASAIDSEIIAEYSPDCYFKYESEKTYCGLIIDDSQNHNFSTNFYDEFESCELFTGLLTLADDCNYTFNCTENDDLWKVTTSLSRDTLSQKINADVSAYLYYCLGYDYGNSKDIKAVKSFYRISDNVYRYDNGVRIYVQYADDIPDFECENAVSLSKPLTDSKGSIYYELKFTENTDIEYALEFMGELESMAGVKKCELSYALDYSEERFSAENIKINNFRFDHELNVDEPFETTQSPTPTESEQAITTTSIEFEPATTTTIATTTVADETKTTATTNAPTNDNETTTENDTSSLANSPDINCDGIINMADAVIVNSVLSGKLERTSYYIHLADVNNDNVIDELDLICVKNALTGCSRGTVNSVTVNLGSISDGLECYVKILGSSDLSGIAVTVHLQKNMFGKYIDIINEKISPNGNYYIYNQCYYTRLHSDYRLIADLRSLNITVSDFCTL